MRIFTRTIIAAIALPALVLAAAACDDGNDDTAPKESAALQASITALQADIAESSARVQRNEMMYGVLTLATLGLHGMDETLNEEGTIDPSFIRKTRTAVRVLALTDWGEFQADADAVRAHGEDLMTALTDENVDAAAAAAKELHEAEHDFSKAVWNVVAKDLKPEFGGPEEEEHEESETPSAGETPEAEATP